MKTTVLSVLFLTCVAGCSFRVLKPSDSLTPRAAFDLGCKVEEVEMTPLDGQCDAVYSSSTETCTMGVRCQEKQATYVFFHKDQTWVMNNAGAKSP
jgi:hypothetical protein